MKSLMALTALAVCMTAGAVPAHGLRNSYGTTSHLTRTGYADRQGLCAKFGGAGGKWMRMDFDWCVLERQRGQWDFKRYDDIIATAESNGVQIVGILTSPPEWAKPVWLHLDEWEGFVRKVAMRYRGRLPVYEIWNEENSKEFWGYEPNATNYVALLKASYWVLKEVDPSIRVALGSLATGGMPFGEQVYAAGAKNFFDIMNVHPYSVYGRPGNPNPEGYVDEWIGRLRAIMGRYGDADKEIWITEIGWPSPHDFGFKARGVLKSGLKAIDPRRKVWRTLVVDRGFDRAGSAGMVLGMVRRELPKGSPVWGCGFDSVGREIASGKPDLIVVSPLGQYYPIGQDKALLDFALSGGVIAEFGGMPFYKGDHDEKGTMTPTQLRRALHFDAHCWWMKDLPAVPREIRVHPTAAASEVAPRKEGYACQRFVSDRFVRPGDVFTPLLEATWTNRVKCVGAAAIRFAKGGGIIVGGMFESLAGVFTEEEQARYVPRSHLVAFEAGVTTVMWYELRSHDFDRHDGGWGLLHADLSEKRGWQAYQTLLTQRPEGSKSIAVAPRRDGVRHTAWTLPDGRRAGALWTERGRKEISLDFLGPRVALTDYLGRTVRSTIRGGKRLVVVSPEVIYYCEDSRPETWFHLIGGNVSREGLTADLEAIKAAGIGGIHLFHGQIGKNLVWPGVTNPVPCLSKDWNAMVAHVGLECRRLGLNFRMQNCPGWSMSGGPWITPENAMRTLAYSRLDVDAPGKVSLPLPVQATDCPSARAYRDLFVLAFPTPLGDSDEPLKPNGVERPSAGERIFHFDHPVTVRSLTLNSTSAMNHDRTYDPQAEITVVAVGEDGRETCVTRQTIPPGNWQDNRKYGVLQTFALDEATARKWKVSVHSVDPVNLGDVRLYSAARLNHWEGLAGWSLRGLVDRGTPRQETTSWIDSARIVNLSGRLSPDGTLDWKPPKSGRWTILRIGHVNGLCKNGPAPAEATGWECSKLSPRGIETVYANYVGRLAKGPLKGLLKGVVVDSWECYRQNWADGLDQTFRTRCGYDAVSKLPAAFGWVIDSPAKTEDFLRDWRGLLGRLIEENYYGRLVELAHADGLEAQYETAFGDALAGDLLSFWKYADTPMCEFWRPTAPTGVGSANFKPVLPCVSAAHVYGKRRVAAEAFTNCALTWDESLRDLKPVLDRHLAKGVTFPVFHTYTHNPQVGFKKPGSSFGHFIGTPFLRGQSWWRFMPKFTDYCTRCTVFLEQGLPAVDILRVLGDGLGHKPDESAPHFANRFKDDYVNHDVLLNGLKVKDGRLELSDGMSYARLWIPTGTYLDQTSQKRIAALKSAGARVVEGDDPTSGLVPDVVSPGDALLWYHRVTEEGDRYFVAAPDRPVSGQVRFRGRAVGLDLEAGESRFVCFAKDGTVSLVDPVTGRAPVVSRKGPARTLSGFAPGAMHASFRISARRAEGMTLDLGRVEQCAEVRVNGKSAGLLWCAPYRLEIGEFLVDGENVIEVDVVPTWHNTLLKEASLPEAERTTWTLYGPKLGSAPKPAGLYGPVRLQS